MEEREREEQKENENEETKPKEGKEMPNGKEKEKQKKTKKKPIPTTEFNKIKYIDFSHKEEKIMYTSNIRKSNTLEFRKRGGRPIFTSIYQ